MEVKNDEYFLMWCDLVAEKNDRDNRTYNILEAFEPLIRLWQRKFNLWEKNNKSYNPRIANEKTENILKYFTDETLRLIKTLNNDEAHNLAIIQLLPVLNDYISDIKRSSK
jgi:hypothetical protein